MASTIQTIETPKHARALDTSGNNNHGQIYSGRALEFDGVTDYLDIGTETTFIDFSAETTQANRAWTVVAWINIDSTNPGWIQNIIGRSGSISSAYISIGGDTTNVGYMQLNDIGTGAWRAGNSKLNINTWYRAAWVFDGDTTVTFYLNGVADGTGEIDNADDNADLTTRYIGARDGGHATSSSERLFKGKIADLQLWRGAFTAADASYDYLNPESLVLSNSGTSLTESNLLAWYPMQDGHRSDQSFVLDASSTGAVSSNLVTNSDFSDGDTGWVVYNDGTGATSGISNGEARLISDGTYTALRQNSILTAGTMYLLQYDISHTSGNPLGLIVQDFNSTVIIPSEVGTNTYTFKAPDGDLHIKRYSSAYSFDTIFTNVSVTPINDKNHATTAFYGDELVSEGGFTGADDDDPWVTNTGWAIASNKATCSSGDDNLTQTISIAVGRHYYVSVDVTRTSGTLSIDLGGATAQTTTSSGVQTFSFVAINTNDLRFYGGAFRGDLEDVSVKEIGTASGWTDADQQLHIPQHALQSYNELLWFRGQDVDSVETDNVVITPSSDVWNATNGEWNSVSCWASFDDSSFDNSGIIWTVDGNPSLFYNASGGSTNIGYNTGNGDVFGVTLAQSTFTNKITHFVMNFKRNTNSNDTAITGDDVEFFINGEKEVLSYVSTTQDSNGCNTVAQSVLTIGDSESNTNANSHVGVVTEISAWNKQLSQTEVYELYNNGKALDALTHSALTNLKGYWRNNGLTNWIDLVASNDGVPSSTCSETITIPAGADSSRDSQGFIMNRSKSTSHLNFSTTTIASGIDGGGEVVRIEDPSLIATNDFSISFWAYKFRDWDGQWVISKYVDANNRWYIKGKESNPPYLEIYAKIGGNDVLSDADTTSLDGAAYMEDWMHVTVTVDRSDTSNGIQWYINGAATSNAGVTAGQTGTSLALASDLVIGMNDDASHDDHHFDGKIDGLLIYGDILTAAEVLKNYKATKR